MATIIKEFKKFDGNRVLYDRVIADGAPNANDDDSLGFVPGSEWVVGTTGQAYRCISSDEGAAVWVASVPGSSLVTDDGSTVTIAGNLEVQGISTHIQSTVVDIADRVVHYNHSTGANDPVPSMITGFSVHRGAVASVARDHAGLFWDETNSIFRFAFNTSGDDATLGTALNVTTGRLAVGVSTFIGSEVLHALGDAYIDGKLTVTGVIDPTQVLLSGADKRFGATDAGTIYLAPFTNSTTAVQIRRADNVTAVLTVNTSIPAVTIAAVVTITGSGLNLASATSNNFINSDTSLAGVSGIASGRIRYNNTNGKWEVSTQASAYTRLVTASASATTVDRLTKFSATAEIANSNISDDGTSVTVLSGGASPSLIVKGTPGGDLQQWFNFATTLSVMDDTGRLILGGTAVAAAEKLRVVGDARIEGKLTVTGVIDPTAVVLTDPPATQELYYESADGQNASTSGANTGRIRYNDVTGTWQQSTQGNAYTDFGSVSGSGTTGKIPIWTSSTAQGDSSLTEGATIVSTKRIFPPGGAGGITLNALVADAPTANYGEILFQQDGTNKGSIYYQDYNGTKDVRIYSYVVSDDIALFDVDTRDVLFYKKLTIGDSFLPYFNNTQSMGSSSMRWMKIYSQILRSNAIQDEGDINRIQLVTSGDLQLRDNTGAVNFSFSLTEATSSLNIIPNADNTYDLGSSTFKWKDGYFAGNVSLSALQDPSAVERIKLNSGSWIDLKNSTGTTVVTVTDTDVVSYLHYLPGVDANFNLGTSTSRFNKAYFANDVSVTDSSKGFVLKDTQGTPHYWRITVSTLGVLVTTDLGTSPP